MKIDRLLGILTILLQNERTTAPELAKKFEVNRRTIGRDIDTLCQAGIPIVTYQGVGGGISIAEGFKLDKRILTTNELSGIIAGLKGLRSVSEPLAIERTLDKLGANADTVVSMCEPVIIDLASHHKSYLTEKIELIKTAVRERKRITFDYYYNKGFSQRDIEPSYVIFQWNSWYVFGFCTTRQDWRLFKLMRLWNLSLSEQQYEPRKVPDENQDFDACHTDDVKLTALFDDSERYKLIEAYGLDCFKETDEGLLFEIGFTNKEFVVDWLLRFGGRVKILEPDYIAKAVQDAAKSILERYES